MTNEVRPLECSFIPITNIPYSDETKLGRYAQSMFWEVPDFGKTKWVILGYLDIDWVTEMEVSGKTQESIIKGCLEFLNVLPERKKYQKTDPRPVYGKLELFRASFKHKNGKPVIIAEFVTDERRNENFWNEGLCPSSYVSPKQKRGEKVIESKKEEEVNV